MVSAILVDISNPSAALLELYDDVPQGIDFPSRVAAHFSDVFSSKTAFERIPPLNVNNSPKCFKDRALVRFRGMVQDIHPSPEMYLSKSASNKCGGWGLPTDHQPESDDVNYADLRESNAFWIVSVPGETDWCRRQLDDESTELTIQPHSYRSHKQPFPDLPSLGVHVKVYDKSSAQSLKPTDVVTVIGILSSEILISDFSVDTVEVPTLHALFIRFHIPTLLEYSFPASNDVIYADLVDWIADEGLGGDRDAAEWVLLASIARVQSRRPALLPPTLALTRFPPPKSTTTTPAIFWVLSELLPFSLMLPLSLDLVNRSRFVPESKDEDLHSGFLQVPSGSVIVVTESGVKEGVLSENGLRNIQATQEIMSSQTIEYIFPYSNFSFNTEINFLVLSEGKKSAFFKTDFTVALETSKDGLYTLYKTKDEIRLPHNDKLEAFRALVGGAKSGIKLKVGDEVAQFIENEFVQERKASSNVTQSDLITRLTIAKLLTVALHRKEVTIDIWERAKELDVKRKNKCLS